MNRRITIAIVIILLIGFMLLIFWQLSPRESDQVVGIPELKGSNLKHYLGKTVVVEGIFVRDPVPMLVTDLDLVRTNVPMPDDRYILLIGDEAERINPEEFGGAKLRVTGTVKAAGGENKQNTVALSDIYYKMINRLVPYAPKIIPMQIVESLNPLPQRYAILFSGGINAQNNHIRYWNDLKFMYKTLIGALGFSKKNIAVLYADGKPADKDMPVHYSATQANLEIVFDLLRKHSDVSDLVFFFTTNHGGGFNTSCPVDPSTNKKQCIWGGQWDADTDEPTESLSEKQYDLDLNNDNDKKDIVSWDEGLNSWGGSILDDALQPIVRSLNFKRMIIVMEQCFSGGLISDVAQGGDRIIISAAGEHEFSWAMSSGNYNEFSYYFTSAINKADPSGNKVDADTDKSKKISLVEAFNFARAKDTKTETPWYEDSGDGLPHSGAMPGQGEGNLGGTTSLEP